MPSLSVPKFSVEDIADALMADAFPAHRSVKSTQYIAGVRAVLMNRLSGKPMEMPYRPGTASADAWEAGKAEGKVISKQASLKKMEAPK
jgi:hypothetical protein